jgi:hypothetical protein
MRLVADTRLEDTKNSHSSRIVVRHRSEIAPFKPDRFDLRDMP